MTPAQEAGWNVGDQGLVIQNNCFRQGAVVELIKDTGDRAPLFKLIQDIDPLNNKTEGGFNEVLIDCVEKIEDPFAFSPPHESAQTLIDKVRVSLGPQQAAEFCSMVAKAQMHHDEYNAASWWCDKAGEFFRH
jgi:hypothetical protein